MQEGRMGSMLSRMVAHLPPPPASVLAASPVLAFLSDDAIDDVALASGSLPVTQCIRCACLAWSRGRLRV